MIVHPSSRGFSLIEALIAALLAATALVSVVHLVTLGARQALASRRATTARALAQAKLEHLRSLPWTYDGNGSRLSSGDLAPSPVSALEEDTGGYVERLDRFGRLAPDGVPVFRRRWSVAPVAGDADTLVLQVCVFAGTGERSEACVWGIRTRRP